MIVPELRVPNGDEFEGYIKEADLKEEGFQKRDRKILVAMSINDQWSDWQTQTIIDAWNYLRLLDAELARRKIAVAKLEAAEQTRNRWRGWGKAVGITFGAALLAGLGKAFIDWLFK